jgi:6-phosphogluconolactonase
MTNWDVYVGTFTSEFQWLTGIPGQGIERYQFNDTDASLRYRETTTGLLSPQYLALHPTLPVLYAAEFASTGNLVAFRIRPDGSLEHLSTTDSLGELAAAVSIHPSTEYAYLANWGSGGLTAFRLDRDGEVVDRARIAHRARQDSPAESEFHPHQIRPTPSGSAILVAYAGIDELTAYHADPDGALSALPDTCIEFPDQCAPRHIEFHPSGNFVYVVGERDSYMYILEAGDGFPFRILDRYPTAPPGHTGRNTPSEVKLHPDGHALYVGNRGGDCVTIFHLDASGRNVLGCDHVPSGGRGPRAVTIDPTGRYLIVGHADSGELAVFSVETDGGLRLAGPVEQAHSPSSIVFFRSG